MISAKRLDVLCIIKKGEFLAATHQYEAVAMQNLVSASATNSEAHNYNVQMRVRQLDQEADARYSHRHRELLSRVSQEANQALEDLRKNLVTEVPSEVWRRNEQLYNLRTELSHQAPRSEDASQKQSEEYAGLHQLLTGLVQESQQYREMFEESRAAHSAGPEIDRLRQREEEFLREVRRYNNDKSKT